jgi:hypothetical protein
MKDIIAIPVLIFVISYFIMLFTIIAIANTTKWSNSTYKPTTIPLSEVRCSDLERAIDECEAADDVALCRGRYDVKIAMCFRGQ